MSPVWPLPMYPVWTPGEVPSDQCDPTIDADTFTSCPAATTTSSCQGMNPLLRTESRWSPGSIRKLHGVRHRTKPSATISIP
jgi:hypothetical protein